MNLFLAMLGVAYIWTSTRMDDGWWRSTFLGMGIVLLSMALGFTVAEIVRNWR